MDLLVLQDEIFKQYISKERYMREQVLLHNRSLTAKKRKSRIVLGLFDVLPHHILYTGGPEILLLEHQLTRPREIKKMFVQIPKSTYGIYFMPDVHKRWHRSITKDFNCFINRNDSIRQSWFYLLYSRSLLDRGFISFNNHARSGITHLSDLEFFDSIHRQTLTSFDSVYPILRSMVPYKNFIETENLCDTICATKFSIVIETYFERTDAVTFSEKTFRVLQTPRPWLLFHATNSVKILRDMGFYVYDDFVDHSYDAFDTESVSVERQEAILEQAQSLSSLDVTDSMLNHWEKMTTKNQQILSEWHRSWRIDYDNVLHQSYNLAME